jgi:hypothetical protein
MNFYSSEWKFYISSRVLIFEKTLVICTIARKLKVSIFKWSVIEFSLLLNISSLSKYSQILKVICLAISERKIKVYPKHYDFISLNEVIDWSNIFIKF